MEEKKQCENIGHVLTPKKPNLQQKRAPKRLRLPCYQDILARGGYTSVPENELWTPTRLVIVRFPSRKDVETFLDSEEYAPIKALRNKYADCTLTIIDGV